MLLHLVVGAALLAVGSWLVARREEIVSRHRARGRSEVPATGFAIVGVILTIGGLVQVILVFS